MFAHTVFILIGILWTILSGIRLDVPATITWVGVTLYAFNNWMKEPFDQ